jgi:hypothetical protein
MAVQLEEESSGIAFPKIFHRSRPSSGTSCLRLIASVILVSASSLLCILIWMACNTCSRDSKTCHRELAERLQYAITRLKTDARMSQLSDTHAGIEFADDEGGEVEALKRGSNWKCTEYNRHTGNPSRLC